MSDTQTAQAFYRWETKKIEKTLGTARLKGADWVASQSYKDSGATADDGKWHVVKTGTVEVDFTYPVLRPLAITDPVTLMQVCQDIISEGREGFRTLRELVEHFNYGLYANLRQAVSKGDDTRYNQAQRNAIRSFTNMLEKDLIEAPMVVELLLRQGITDAQEIVDRVEMKKLESETAPSANGSTA